MEKTDHCLNVYLGPSKKAWLRYCKSMGQKPGVVLKQIVEQQLRDSVEDENHQLKYFQQTSETINNEEKQRFEILLTVSEKAALKKRAQQERCSMRRWIIDAIRVGLTRQPQLSTKEIEVLGESNYQLLAIGRNLNQIVKVIHEGHQNLTLLTAVQELRQTIDAHTKTVNHTLCASLERWKLK